MSVAHDSGVVEVQVTDDGIGGADPQRGSDYADSTTGSQRSMAASSGQRRRSGHDPDSDDAMRVIVADDSMLLREGVVRVLEDAGIDVVAQASNGEELMRQVRLHTPDVAIIDLRMPPTYTDEGLRAALAIRAEMPGDRSAGALAIPGRPVRAGAARPATQPASATSSRTASPTSNASPGPSEESPRAARPSTPRSSHKCWDAAALSTLSQR